MGIPVLLGLFAAMVVFASRVLREAWGSYLWDAPKFLLLVTGSAALFLGSGIALGRGIAPTMA